MLQNLKLETKTAQEFLLLRKEMIPKEARCEELKTAMRGFGPGEYPVDGLGEVRVSQPSIARKTGVKLTANEAQIGQVDPTVLGKLFECGFLAWEDVWTRASASKVEARFPDAS